MSQARLPPPPPPQWVVSLNSPMPRPSKGASSIPDPPGFSSNRGKQRQQQQSSTKKPEETDTLKMKKAWEVAMAPSKQIPMNAIMMYMSGNSLQIFSIMMVLMLFKGPIQGIINTNAAFAKYESPSTHSRLLGVKIVYMLMQLLLLGLGIWKVNAMGLLPYVWLLLLKRFIANTIDQNYKIGLASVGVRTYTFGARPVCFQMINGT
ncbi:hypothetical protein N7541_003782 [Penicillium brevicompactum]|uniref:ER membrane protein complex subunit 4 n=1 Tax=Penicillium brevicompactum TaxID=5074 RepID=A0A9W9RSD6_PENBR|nr:hypothetical protein N7541_003782 [Penicillium brevicompactum]